MQSVEVLYKFKLDLSNSHSNERYQWCDLFCCCVRTHAKIYAHKKNSSTTFLLRLKKRKVQINIWMICCFRRAVKRTLMLTNQIPAIRCCCKFTSWRESNGFAHYKRDKLEIGMNQTQKCSKKFSNRNGLFYSTHSMISLSFEMWTSLKYIISALFDTFHFILFVH